MKYLEPWPPNFSKIKLSPLYLTKIFNNKKEKRMGSPKQLHWVAKLFTLKVSGFYLSPLQCKYWVAIAQELGILRNTSIHNFNICPFLSSSFTKFASFKPPITLWLLLVQVPWLPLSLPKTLIITRIYYFVYFNPLLQTLKLSNVSLKYWILANYPLL